MPDPLRHRALWSLPGRLTRVSGQPQEGQSGLAASAGPLGARTLVSVGISASEGTEVSPGVQCVTDRLLYWGDEAPFYISEL